MILMNNSGLWDRKLRSSEGDVIWVQTNWEFCLSEGCMTLHGNDSKGIGQKDWAYQQLRRWANSKVAKKYKNDKRVEC